MYYIKKTDERGDKIPMKENLWSKFVKKFGFKEENNGFESCIYNNPRDLIETLAATENI